MIEYIAAAAGGVYLLIDYIHNYELHKIKNRFIRVMRGAGIKSKREQTYEILKAIKRDYGCDLIISIPEGLSYEKLEEKLPEIESGIRCVTELEWKRFKGCAYMKTATDEYDTTKRFEPIKTEGPWELYFGETYFHEELKADIREYPHVLVAGSTGTGKSRCLFIALTNLLYWYDDVDLYLAQVSDKKDLQKFAHYRQTKYFAQNLQTTDRMIQQLLEEQKTRNQLLNKYGMNNIDEYNKRFKDDMLKYIYMAIDEFASLMPGEKDTDPYYAIKKRIIFNLNELARQARSAGIFIITSLQRPDKTNLDPNLKNLFNIKVAFRANNIASSKVLTDDDSAFNLPNREALFMGSFQKTLKTPYVDDHIIETLLRDKSEKDHKYINLFPEEPETHEDNVIPIVEQKPQKSKGVLPKC